MCSFFVSTVLRMLYLGSSSHPSYSTVSNDVDLGVWKLSIFFILSVATRRRTGQTKRFKPVSLVLGCIPWSWWWCSCIEWWRFKGHGDRLRDGHVLVIWNATDDDDHNGKSSVSCFSVLLVMRDIRCSERTTQGGMPLNLAARNTLNWRFNIFGRNFFLFSDPCF